jgi:dipeptidyl-peptidase-3
MRSLILHLSKTLGALCCLGLFACSSPQKVAEVEPLFNPADLPSPPASEGLLISVDGGTGLLRLRAEGFDQLPLQQKLYAYYLYRAAIAGRDISVDQRHRHALEIRRLLDLVLTHQDRLEKMDLISIYRFAKLFWLNNGYYHARTGQRIQPGFDLEDLTRMITAAGIAGADLEGVGSSLDRVAWFLFNPEAEPRITEKRPPEGGDLLLDSYDNFYGPEVSSRDLTGFVEKYPGNSSLVKVDGVLQEQVWRAGNYVPGTTTVTEVVRGRRVTRTVNRPVPPDAVAPGRYSKELTQVVEWLGKAAQFAPGAGQRDYLQAVIKALQTGDPAAMDEAWKLWVNLDAEVDVVLGFVESYLDPRGQKGEYEGLVMFKDNRVSRILSELAYLAPEMEERAPWADAYKNRSVRPPLANAMVVLNAVGGAGPSVPLGINLPNSPSLRERTGTKSLILTNVLAALQREGTEPLLREFTPPEELKTALNNSLETTLVLTALLEVVGHGSGRVSPGLDKDPSWYLKQHYAVIEEARALAAAVYFASDEALLRQGVVSSSAIADEAMRGLLRQDLMQLRRVPKGETKLSDAHMMAQHLLASHLKAHCKCTATGKGAGKTFVTVKDLGLARASLAKLLAELQRIKSEGDFAAAEALVKDYALSFDPELRDEVRERCDTIGTPSFFAFHTPVLRLLADDQGRAIDVLLDDTLDFEDVMLSWDLGDAEATPVN